MKEYNYYQSELNKIETGGDFAPAIKIVNGGYQGSDTNFMDLNERSAPILVNWLTTNFIQKDRQIYFKSYSDSIEYVKAKFTIEELPEIACGTWQYRPAPGVGETARIDLPLLGKYAKAGQWLHIQIYVMDSGTHELNYYIL